MHEYDRKILNDWPAWWLFMPLCLWLIVVSVWLSIPTQHHEPGVRHALPDPCVMYCLPAGYRELSSFAEMDGQG